MEMNYMTYKMEQLLEKKSVKSKIIESLKRTKEKNVEHAFNFCVSNWNGDRDGDRDSTTEIEEGQKNGINIENKCRAIGGFHTHTKHGDVVPSPKDIIKSIEENFEFFCVGGNLIEDIGIVRCFNKENLLLEMNAILAKRPRENIQKASRHMVRRMLSDKDYLDQLSYKTKFAYG